MTPTRTLSARLGGARSESGFPGATAAVGVKNFHRPETPDFIEPTAERPVGFLFAHGLRWRPPTYERDTSQPERRPARPAARGVDSVLRHLPEQVRHVRDAVPGHLHDAPGLSLPRRRAWRSAPMASARSAPACWAVTWPTGWAAAELSCSRCAPARSPCSCLSQARSLPLIVLFSGLAGLTAEFYRPASTHCWPTWCLPVSA